jgi:inorganic pyrophosphatase
MKNDKSLISDLISLSSVHDIETMDEITFRDMYIPHEGAPQKHPFDKTKVVLVKNPFEENAGCWEFPVAAIGRVEESESIGAEDGRTALILRLWIRKGTKAVFSTPYTVM